AETLRSLHATGRAATRKARLLGLAGATGALIAWMRDGMAVLVDKLKWPAWLALPERFPIPGLRLAGRPAVDFPLSFSASLLLVAAGAIMGLRVSWSLLAGAIVNYGVLAPAMYRAGVIDAQLGFRHIARWSVWTGVAIMVASSLVHFALEWRVVA